MLRFVILAPAAPPASLSGIRVVAFDLDGTLVDFLATKKRAAEAAAWALADAGLPIDPRHAAREIVEVAHDVGPDHDDVVEEWMRRRGVRDARLDAIGREAYAQGEQAAARPYPRVQRTLAELVARGYVLGIVTDADRHRAERRLRGAGLLPYLAFIVAREDSPRGKAGPEPFHLAAALAGVAPEAILMVGDNPRLDVASARAAGCHAALAAYGLTAKFANAADEANAIARLSWFDELLDLLPPRGAPENVKTPEGPRLAGAAA